MRARELDGGARRDDGTAPTRLARSASSGAIAARLARRAARVVAAAAALVALGGDARAADAPAAQALFDEAKRAMADGRWAEACPKLEESERLDPSIGTAFNLARCYEHVGRIASAWAAYRDAEASAHAQAQPAREKVARERAAALEPKLSKLVVTVRTDAPGLEIRRDGVDVGRGQWGAEVPVDPGEHTVTASATGRVRWERAVRVAPGTKTMTIDVPELAPAPVVAPAMVTELPPPSAAPPPLPAPIDERRGRGRAQRTVGIVVGALGVVGVGVGAAYGLRSKAKHDDATSRCDDAVNRCDPLGAVDRHDAVVYGTASTIAFAAGGAALLGGVVLWATAPSDRPQSAALGVSPMIGGTSGLTIRGAF